MTVYIEKPAVNLREELADLRKPSGITGESLLRADVAADAREVIGLDNHELVVVDTSGNVAFTDNQKAIFGAGSDLQIYHDGANSYISELGAGELILLSNGSTINLQATPGAEYMARFYKDAQVELYYDNAKKLSTTSTGVDVTGTITSDGLTVDGGANSELRIDTDASGYLQVGQFTNGAFIGTSSADAAAGILRFGTVSTERIRVATNGDISFYEDTGTTPKFFWDASAEALGIGTSSPSRTLSVVDVTSDGSGGILVQNYLPAIELDDASGGGTSTIIKHDGTATIIENGGTERLRIDASGNLLVGTTSGLAKLDVRKAAAGAVAFFYKSDTSDNPVLVLRHDRASGATSATQIEFSGLGGIVGSITTTGSATSYNTSSDYRLKENVEPLTGAADRVLALKPSRFNFIAEPDKTVDGFIAHEAQEVVPEAVHGVKDAVDADGNPQYQGIDQSKLVPLLTAALQEALTEIASLKARLDAANL